MAKLVRNIKEEVEQTILRSLRFATMRDRPESLAEAHKKTFEWIFEETLARQQPWDSFTDWLISDNGLYWINGKAGSGKSTLMRFISTHENTSAILRAWSGGARLEIASYYFWNSGVLEQRSQAGLLRSLLYDILSKQRNLIPLIFLEDWQHLTSNLNPSMIEPIHLSMQNLRKAFTTLMRQASSELKFCFLIDGLDEYEGDHEDIAEFFQNLATTPHVKFLLSSRPWPVFDDIFAGCPRLKLQDLTIGDIDVYVHDRLEKNRKMHMLIHREPAPAQELINEIKQKACGVFLWVKVVVKSFINGLREGDEIEDLRKALRALPPDLEELYDHMLRSISPNHLEDASKMFQILRTALSLPGGGEQVNIPILEGAFSAVFDSVMQAPVQQRPSQADSDLEKQHARYEQFELRLRSRTKGLLEVQPTANIKKDTLQDDYPPVSFLHRTVKDYVEKRQIWEQLLMHTSKTDFSPLFGLLMNDLTTLKNARAYSDAQGIAEHFVFLSQQLEGKNISREAALLSEFNRVRLYWSNSRNYGEGENQMVKWVNEESTGFMQIDWDHDFLNLAIIYDLPWYVDHKLQNNGSLIHAGSAMPLLACALAWDRGLDYNSGPKPSPEVKLGYLKRILSLGADPNVLYKKEPLWRYVIHYVHTKYKEWSASKPTAYDPCFYWIQVLDLMLQSGASIHACCFHKDEEGVANIQKERTINMELINAMKGHQHSTSPSETHSLAMVIRESFGKKYPEESTRLVRLVESRQAEITRMTNKKRKRKHREKSKVHI